MSVGKTLKGLGLAVALLGGLWVYALCVGIVYKAWGFFGVVLATALLPVLLGIAPFYAGVARGDWWPLEVGVGVFVISFGLFALGLRLAPER